jgi:non-homologous end joining protein Ku
MCVLAYDYTDEKYYVLDEYFAAEKSTEDHAAEIRKLIDKWNIDFIYIDSAN